MAQDRNNLQEDTFDSIVLAEKAMLAATKLVRIHTQGEYSVLVYLDERNESATAVEIAEHVSLTRPRITQIVSSLEERGYVSRTRDDEDRRRVNVELTAEGRKAVRDQRERAMEGFRGYLEKLGDDGDAFIRILHKTIEYFDEKYGVTIK